jgi:hypothetical protein
MISLATTSTGNRITPDIGEARPSGDAKGGFSAVLAQHGPQESPVSDSKPSETGDKTALPPVAERGTALPETAESGKKLPVELPEAAVLPESGEIVAEGQAVEAALALAVMTQIALPVAAAEDDVAAEGETPAATPQPKTTQPAPILPGAVRAAGETQAEGTSPKTAPAQRDTAISVQVAQGPSDQAPAEDNATDGGDAEGGAPAPRRDLTAERTVARFTQPEVVKQADQAAQPALATATTTTTAANTIDLNRPAMRTDTLTEMTRLVDRLAAAREVFAPATASVAIEHAEFGELSLRFDQRRDGGLSVQLSANNPEAHRAVTQAVSAQSFQNAADDRAGTGQQAANQQQNSARSGGTSDRDSASGNGSAARHDQGAPQHQQRRHADAQTHSSPAPAGVFA